MRKFSQKFIKDESGQSLMVAALTVFILLVMVGLVIGVGEVTTHQMRVQNAADAAAYSGAAVQADCLAQIAWINDGMAQIYYDLTRGVVDNIVLSTDYQLASAGWWDVTLTPDGKGMGGTLPDLSSVKGWPDVDNAKDRFDSARGHIKDAYDEGILWLERLSRIERSIAIVGKNLILHQVYHTAQINFYSDNDKDGKSDDELRTSVYPYGFELYPESAYYVDAVIEKTGALSPEPWQPNGWHISSNTNPEYELTAEHTAHSESTNDGKKETTDAWDFTIINPKYPDGVSMLIEQDIYEPASAKEETCSKCGTNYKNLASRYLIKPTGSDEVEVWLFDDPAYAQSPMIKRVGDTYECIVPSEAGATVCKVSYLWDSEGFLTLNGQRVNEETSMTVNGTKVAAPMPEWLEVDGGYLKLGTPSRMRILDMDFLFYGTQMDIRYPIPAGWVDVKTDRVLINSISTMNADGRWRDYGVKQTGRHYHRMKVLESDTKWHYERIMIGSYTREMDFLKVITRAMAKNGDSLPNNWWYVPTSETNYGGEKLQDNYTNSWTYDEDDWLDDADGVWLNYPNWMRAPRTMLSDGDTEYGGFYDVRTGRTVEAYRSYQQDGSFKRETTSKAEYAYSRTKEGAYDPGNYNKKRIPADKAFITRVVYEHFTIQSLDPSVDLGDTCIRRKCVGDIPGLYWKSLNPAMRLYYPKGTTYRIVDPVTDPNKVTYTRLMPEKLKITSDPAPFWIEGPYNYEELFGVDAETTLTRTRLRELYDALNLYNNDTYQIVDGVIAESPISVFQDPDRLGDWYIQFLDPMGSAPSFRHEPMYYDSTTSYYDEPYDNFEMLKSSVGNVNSVLASRLAKYAEDMSSQPARVRRYLYHAYSMDVGSYPTNSNSRYHTRQISPNDYFSVDLALFEPLLEVTSEMFRSPLVVSVHAPAQHSWLQSLFGKSRDDISDKRKALGQGSPLHVEGDSSDKWSSGHFAFSAARVFLKSPTDEWITNFAYGDTGAPNSANPTLQFYDAKNIIGQHVSGFRQKWIKSTYNLFEPSWTAALVPFRAAVKIEDKYSDLDEGEVGTPDDNSISYLMRQMQRPYWVKSAADIGNGNRMSDYSVNLGSITAPPMQGGQEGNSLSLDSPLMEGLVNH